MCPSETDHVKNLNLPLFQSKTFGHFLTPHRLRDQLLVIYVPYAACLKYFTAASAVAASAVFNGLLQLGTFVNVITP